MDDIAEVPEFDLAQIGEPHSEAEWCRIADGLLQPSGQPRVLPGWICGWQELLTAFEHRLCTVDGHSYADLLAPIKDAAAPFGGLGAHLWLAGARVPAGARAAMVAADALRAAWDEARRLAMFEGRAIGFKPVGAGYEPIYRSAWQQGFRLPVPYRRGERRLTGAGLRFIFAADLPNGCLHLGVASSRSNGLGTSGRKGCEPPEVIEAARKYFQETGNKKGAARRAIIEYYNNTLSADKEELAINRIRERM